MSTPLVPLSKYLTKEHPADAQPLSGLATNSANPLAQVRPAGGSGGSRLMMSSTLAPTGNFPLVDERDIRQPSLDALKVAVRGMLEVQEALVRHLVKTYPEDVAFVGLITRIETDIARAMEETFRRSP